MIPIQNTDNEDQLTFVVKDQLSSGPYVRLYSQEDFFSFPEKTNEKNNSNNSRQFPFNRVVIQTIANMLNLNKSIFENTRQTSSFLENGKQIYLNKKLYWQQFLSQYSLIGNGLKTLVNNGQKQLHDQIMFTVLAISNLLLKLGISMSKICVLILNRNMLPNYLSIPILASLFLQFLQFRLYDEKSQEKKNQEGGVHNFKINFIKQLPKLAILKFIKKRNPYDIHLIQYSQRLFSSTCNNVLFIEVYEEQNDLLGSNLKSEYVGYSSINTKTSLELETPYGQDFLLYFKMLIFNRLNDFKPDLILMIEDYPNEMVILQKQTKGLMLNLMMENITPKIYVIKEYGFDQTFIGKQNTIQKYFEEDGNLSNYNNKLYKSSVMSEHISEAKHLDQYHYHQFLNVIKIEREITNKLNVFYREEVRLKSLTQTLEYSPKAEVDRQLYSHFNKSKRILFDDLTYTTLSLIQHNIFQDAIQYSHLHLYKVAFIDKLRNMLSQDILKRTLKIDNSVVKKEKEKEKEKKICQSKHRLEGYQSELLQINYFTNNQLYQQSLISKSINKMDIEMTRPFSFIHITNQSEILVPSEIKNQFNIQYAQMSEIQTYKDKITSFYNIKTDRIEQLFVYNPQMQRKQQIQCTKDDDFYVIYKEQYLIVFILAERFFTILKKRYGDQYFSYEQRQTFWFDKENKFSKSFDAQIRTKSSIYVASQKYLYRAFGVIENKGENERMSMIYRFNLNEQTLKVTKWQIFEHERSKKKQILDVKKFGYGYYDKATDTILLMGGYNYMCENQQKINKYFFIFSNDNPTTFEKIGKTTDQLFKDANNKKKILFPFVYGIPLLSFDYNLAVVNTNGFLDNLNNYKKVFLSKIKISPKEKGIVYQHRIVIEPETKEQCLVNKNRLVQLMINSQGKVNIFERKCTLRDNLNREYVVELNLNPTKNGERDYLKITRVDDMMEKFRQKQENYQFDDDHALKEFRVQFIEKEKCDLESLSKNQKILPQPIVMKKLPTKQQLYPKYKKMQYGDDDLKN